MLSRAALSTASKVRILCPVRCVQNGPRQSVFRVTLLMNGFKLPARARSLATSSIMVRRSWCDGTLTGRLSLIVMKRTLSVTCKSPRIATGVLKPSARSRTLTLASLYLSPNNSDPQVVTPSVCPHLSSRLSVFSRRQLPKSTAPTVSLPRL